MNTGLPITRPLYLDYPGEAAAYANPAEYLYGPDMLVAPATTPGNVTSERVWFPPGKWTDWFTGATFQGPSTQTLTVPLDRMPVFVKAGGIIPEQAPMESRRRRPARPPPCGCTPGRTGRFTLYQDAGSGTGYQKGQSSLTSDRRPAARGAAPAPSSIGPARGSYPGEQTTRSFGVDMVGVSQPAGGPGRRAIARRRAAGPTIPRPTPSRAVTGLPRTLPPRSPRSAALPLDRPSRQLST